MSFRWLMCPDSFSARARDCVEPGSWHHLARRSLVFSCSPNQWYCNVLDHSLASIDNDILPMEVTCGYTTLMLRQTRSTCPLPRQDDQPIPLHLAQEAPPTNIHSLKAPHRRRRAPASGMVGGGDLLQSLSPPLVGSWILQHNVVIR